jgi:actin-related protein
MYSSCIYTAGAYMKRERSDYYKEYYAKNKEKKLARGKVRGKEYREENKEELKKKRKEYYEQNKERLKEQNKQKRLEKYRSNPEQDMAKQKEWKINNIERYLVQSARNRAKKYNLPFDITHEDVVVPEFCPYLGIKLVPFSEWSSPSLDKIVPELGYVKGNIQVISTKANTMKNNATQDELVRFAEAVLNKNTGRMLEVTMEEL